ncbi:MAG: hypothetical protein AB8B60_16895 [Sulfitobacter sp.]
MNRLLFFVLIALVSAALVGGFTVVGGPQTARMEKADRERANDLRDWGRHYTCVLDTEGVILRNCAGRNNPPDSMDPVTDAPYRFARLDETTFEVCATFQTSVMQNDTRYSPRSLSFSGDEGCLRYARKDAGSLWELQ